MVKRYTRFSIAGERLLASVNTLLFDAFQLHLHVISEAFRLDRNGVEVEDGGNNF